MSRVLLLFGGRSAEHDVSCVSAVAIYEALVEGGHRVIPVGIDRDGRWSVADPASRPFHAKGRPASFRVPGGALVVAEDDVEFDVVFPVLHGPFGEDGTIQGMFEMAGKPYIGCGVLASAIAMDKDVAKRLLEGAGLNTPRWQVVRRGDFADDPAGTVERIGKALGTTVFVKPNALGSSVGVAKARTPAEIKDAIGEALRHGDKVIVDEFIDGREIEVAILEGPRAALPGEVLSANEWYDYDAKYNDEDSVFEVPARLSQQRTAEVQALAARAFTAVEGKGLARVDFFLEEAGRGFLVNEVNTMPGFTPISGFPKMWMASGMSYAELCNELVELALGD
ncbi:MAG: D-alanine--D-alanine ligase family protein [Acidimicrobiia bacterium]|nr:MAG: D-alanine--D-alanine ligase family protein [Acidimicrobiia bacterium]